MTGRRIDLTDEPAENAQARAEAAEQRVRALELECTRLRDALVLVEWVWFSGQYICPKCWAPESGTGHLRGCSTGEALAPFRPPAP